MSQVNVSYPTQQSSLTPNQKILVGVLVVLVIVYIYNFDEVNKWVSNTLAPYMPHSDAQLGGVTSGTNPAVNKPVTPNTVVDVTKVDDSLTPPVKSIVITKDTTGVSRQATDNDDWQTFQIGEVKAYNVAGVVLKADDYESVSYTAGNVETVTPWNQTVIHPAFYAVDGDPSTFTHTATNGGNVHQLTLVLKQAQPLSKVEILNRSDCCQSRLKNAVVNLKDVQGVVIRNKVLDESMTQSVIL